MEHSATDPLSPNDRIRVAGIAACDPRAVRNFIEGRPNMPSVRARIIAALRSLGWLERANVRPEARVA